MKRFEFLEHTADYRIKVEARSRELLFINTGYSIASIMYNIEKVNPVKVKVLKMEGETLEEMFKNFVSNLILTVCKDYFLYSKVNVALKQNGRAGTAKLAGEPLDKKKHEVYKEIKALTEHGFSLEKKGRIWKVIFVVDV